mgnify:CR=1 FL=1
MPVGFAQPLILAPRIYEGGAPQGRGESYRSSYSPKC